MNTRHNLHPRLVTLLIVLLALLGLGGIGGGLVLLIDPSGASMGLPPGLLDRLPFSSFLLPGLFLLTIMGLAPFALAYGLWNSRRWSWPGTLAIGIILILWIFLQIYLWGSPLTIQIVFMAWGLALTVLALLPPVREHFGFGQL